MPGSRQVVRKQFRQVDPEEAAGLDHVMDGRAADQVLKQKKRRDDDKVPRSHALSGGQCD